MTYLVKGGNTAIESDRLEVVVGWQSERDELRELDVSAFLLLDSHKVSSSSDMVFYNQEQSGNDELRIINLNQPSDEGGYGSVFAVELDRVPEIIESIAITVSIPEEVEASFTGLSRLSLAVLGDEQQLVEFTPLVEDIYESSLIIGEFYRHQGSWKFRAVGQDFEGKLGQLASHFAVEVADGDAGADSASSLWQPEPSPRTKLPQGESFQGTASESRSPSADSSTTSEGIVLTVIRTSLKLSRPGDHGEVQVNLNWLRQRRRWFRRPKPIDLDLGCLFEHVDGRLGVVQALGESPGSFEQMPFIRLVGDDRTGDVAQGEWLRINGQHWQNIRRVLVFAFIHDQVTNWPEVSEASLTFHAPGNPPISVKIEGGESKGMCAVALLENSGDGMLINRELRYFANHSSMDRAYGWGIEWRAGSK